MRFKSKFVVAGMLAGMSAMLCMLLGCFGLEGEDSTDTVTITIDAIGSITAGSYKAVDGKIDANVAIETVTYAIKDSAGAAVTSKVTVSSQSVNGEKDADLTDDAEVKINTTADACNGTYTLSISVVAGSATSTQSQTFTVTGGTCGGGTGTPVTVTTLGPIGSNQASAGSSIDLDAGQVYTSLQAGTHVADLDLCYSYSGTDSADKLFTPSHAKKSGYTYAANWSNPPTTAFIKTSLTPALFDSVGTKEEVEALWTGTQITTSAVCIANDVFIVKTTANAYALVLISAQTPGATGTITIKLAK